MSAASCTSALLTFWPCSPVCLVTSGYLNMTSAARATSSRLVRYLTPPKSVPLSLKRPLPRPPAWTWALRTTGLPPIDSKAATASARRGAPPRGRGGGRVARGPRGGRPPRQALGLGLCNFSSGGPGGEFGVFYTPGRRWRFGARRMENPGGRATPGGVYSAAPPP